MDGRCQVGYEPEEGKARMLILVRGGPIED